MANFLSYYKKNNPNLYSLLVSLLLALWYNGISGILNYYWPNKGPALSIVFLMLPLLIFLTDDGHLNELYKPPDEENTTTKTAVQATNAATQTMQNSDRTERFKQRENFWM